MIIIRRDRVMRRWVYWRRITRTQR